MELVEFLEARIAEDEARVRPMLSEAWPEEVVVQVGGGDREPCVTVGQQETPKAYLRIWRPGTEHQVEFGWQAHGVPVWGPSVAARVLTECDAKRRIVAQAEEHMDSAESDGGGAMCIPEPWADTLRLLALPYADHADYQPEWKV